MYEKYAPAGSLGAGAIFFDILHSMIHAMVPGARRSSSRPYVCMHAVTIVTPGGRKVLESHEACRKRESCMHEGESQRAHACGADARAHPLACCCRPLTAADERRKGLRNE